MLKIAENTELNQISLTGLRGIAMMELLLEAPRSLQELRDIFIDWKIMEPEHSNDILRIDLNTLRYMGCEISRADARTDGKYVLTKHPFSINISNDEIAVLNRAYKKIKAKMDIALALKFDDLFKKFAEHMNDGETKENLLGISILRSVDTAVVKDLIGDCKHKRTLKLIYKNPSAKESSEKTIICQKIALQNDNVYLYGFDVSKNKSVVLNAKRILSIISRLAGDFGVEIRTTNVKFFLKSFGISELNEENEEIVETLENGYIVEGKYYNSFFAIQRVLSFGSNCTVLEPVEIREEVVNKLKSMRDVYNA